MPAVYEVEVHRPGTRQRWGGKGAGREREDEEPEAAEGGGPRRGGLEMQELEAGP